MQTSLHVVEKRVDPSYEWNEWALRRRALDLANPRNPNPSLSPNPNPNPGVPLPRVGMRRAADEQQAYAEFETLLTDYSEGRAPRPDLPQPPRDTKKAIDFTRLRNMQ